MAVRWGSGVQTRVLAKNGSPEHRGSVLLSDVSQTKKFSKSLCLELCLGRKMGEGSWSGVRIRVLAKISLSAGAGTKGGGTWSKKKFFFFQKRIFFRSKK